MKLIHWQASKNRNWMLIGQKTVQKPNFFVSKLLVLNAIKNLHIMNDQNKKSENQTTSCTVFVCTMFTVFSFDNIQGSTNFSYLDLLSGFAIGAAIAGGRLVSQLAISSRTLLAFELTSDPLDALRSNNGLDRMGSSSSNSRPSGRPRVLNPLSNDPADSVTKIIREHS